MASWPRYVLVSVTLLLVYLLVPGGNGAAPGGPDASAAANLDHAHYLPLIRGGPGAAVSRCANHNPSLYHPLYEAALNCHYGHEHKHDPDSVAAIFGPAGAWFGGSSISYPWQTPAENTYKHEAYGYVTRHNLAARGQTNWIRALRVQGHVTNEPFVMPDGSLTGGYLGDIHSYSAEAQVCRVGGDCGLVRFGGWLDFGCLQVFNIGGLLYNCLPDETEGPLDGGIRQVFPNGKSVWYGEGRLNGQGREALFRVTLAFGQADSAIWVDASNVTIPQYFCADRQCGFNSSTLQQHVLRFTVPASMDPDGDGYADFAGYTDLWGQLRDACTAPGPDCVPVELVHAPVGNYEHRDDEHGYAIDDLPEFDTSPPGLWWISGPN